MRLADSRFLKACRREAVDRTPIWLMRQAGRYMPEYRALREKHTLLTLCKTPELAAHVTLQPIQRFHFDAAIIFADILLPIEPLGLKLEFAKGEGPVIHNPVSNDKDVDALQVFDPKEKLSFVADAIQIVTRELNDTPLIGFAGAPFTLASYMIEGGYSRHFLKTRKIMLSHQESWKKLMEKLAGITAAYLQMQVEAGASAVQLFDSWVGVLSPEDYRNFVLPYSQKILQSIKVPTIHFSTGTSGYLNLIAEAGGDVISVDWRIELDRAWNSFPDRAIQGNLDPSILLGPWSEVQNATRKILSRAAGKPGHVFNLGHGILPETPVENVEKLVELVSLAPNQHFKT
ncbi:MAG TPA: uroporphyrinogen decarboxylase [Acidobacteriota bacterium]|nr:uroporphyrinogen decarboxylase [Acidobacteriota bacterium]